MQQPNNNNNDASSSSSPEHHHHNNNKPISYDFKSDYDVPSFLRLISQSNGRLPNYFHTRDLACQEALDNLMTYGDLFGKEVNQMTIRSHLLVFYYCVSAPLVTERLNREIRECITSEKHAGEVLPCGDLIMKGKRLADRAIELSAQLEEKNQRERGQGSFYEQLLRVQNNCLPYLIKEKLCNKFLDQCEKEMLEVTPTMRKKCLDLERTSLECVESVFCKNEQEKYLKCMNKVGAMEDDCAHEKSQMTMCGETHQALARLVSLERNPDYKTPAK